MFIWLFITPLHCRSFPRVSIIWRKGMWGKESLLRRACLFLLLAFSLSSLPGTLSECRKYPRIFNFGDSNSDTGGLVAGLGFPVNLPNGRSFFRRSTGRLCDGRLVIDFLCESLKMDYLSPYLESVGSNFSNGVNFAVAGSSTRPTFVPFNLNIQVLQFLRFKARALEVSRGIAKAEIKCIAFSYFSGSGHLIDDAGFHNALYAFDIGQNDLSNAFSAKLSFTEVVGRIPLIIGEIKNAIMAVYKEGARNFWIHNTGPLGCLPQQLSLFNKDNKDLDPRGCLKSFNDAARAFNSALNALCDKIRSELKDATIVYVDIYTIKYGLISSSAKYGFKSPLIACCGHGGPPYNYNINITCGLTAYQVCDGGSRYISWDGVHYSEAANAIIASEILSSRYSQPNYKFNYFCQA